jgi:predicted nucleotidyltransferase
MIPPFDASGDLPSGIHRATMEEICTRFCRGQVREYWGNILREVIALSKSTGKLQAVYLSGSFVTAKETPADVDLFLVMSSDFTSHQVEGRARLLFDRSRAAMVWGICVYWITARTDRTPFLEVWQLRRDGGRRGIVEVQE